MIQIAIVFAVYLLVMVALGLKFYNKQDTMSDYILGGRKLNGWVTAMSAQASDMSGWLLVGLPGTAYVIYVGTSEAIWTAVGLALGTYLNWLFTAKRLRKYTYVSGDSITLPDFFENRFRDSKHILRIISAAFTVVFFIVYTSAQFSTFGKLFTTIFGMPYVAGLFIGAAIILLYTAFGGFNAVCWTDAIMGTIMFFALLIVPVVAVGRMDGWEVVAERLNSMTPETLGFLPANADGSVNGLLLASALGWGLGYFGQPHILARFMAIKSPDEIQKSRIIAMFWVIVTLACGVMVGIIGRALYPELTDPETVFMNMCNDMFVPIISGVLLTAILAAVMSTASSQLLVSASSVTRDLYAVIFKKPKDGHAIVWISRVTVVAVAVIGVLIALNPDSSVFDLVSFAWSGFGAAFGPLIVFALFWRRMTRQGAYAGMLVGGIVDVSWYFMSGGIFDIYEIIPGWISGILAIIIVSLATKLPEEIAAEFDSVKQVKF